MYVGKEVPGGKTLLTLSERPLCLTAATPEERVPLSRTYRNVLRFVLLLDLTALQQLWKPVGVCSSLTSVHGS